MTARSLHVRLSITLAAAAIATIGAEPVTAGAAEPVPSHSSTAPPGPAPNTARMEQVIRSYVAKNQFMGTVLVARGDRILLSKGYGFANLEWHIPNSPDTKFRLGSITKQFTAASILLLQERGKLNVHDLLKKYMPDEPPAWDKITIFNLLTHTSGIPNYTALSDFASEMRVSETPLEIIAHVRNKPLDFAPGTKWNYSNSGYVVLGYVIEKVSDEPYAQFVQQNIFGPLGMKDSGYDSNTRVIEHRAAGYTPGPGGLLNAAYIDMSVPFAAGGLYSTTRDLLRWEQALFGGRPLSRASLEEMTQPFKQDYAFGLEVRADGGQRVIEHSGGINGFSTDLVYYPQSRTTVAVLANVNGAAPDEIATYLGTLAQGKPVVLPSERRAVHVDEATLARYVGDYKLSPTFLISVTREGDRLFTQATGQAKLEIFPSSDTEFFAKLVNAQITFVTGGKTGEATALILHQGGIDQRAERVEGAAAALAPKEHKEVHVDSQTLAHYVGTYQLVPGFSIAITRDGDRLFSQATNQARVEIYPEGEKDFFLKVVDAQITFVTDAQGVATALILHQGGRDLTAKRMQ